jgi:hypothetical protein
MRDDRFDAGLTQGLLCLRFLFAIFVLANYAIEVITKLDVAHQAVPPATSWPLCLRLQK